MTTEQAKLKLELQKAIDKWMEKNCETTGWEETNIYAHESIAEQMTTAAWAVFQASYEAQAFEREHG